MWPQHWPHHYQNIRTLPGPADTLTVLFWHISVGHLRSLLLYLDITWTRSRHFGASCRSINPHRWLSMSRWCFVEVSASFSRCSCQRASSAARSGTATSRREWGSRWGPWATAPCPRWWTAWLGAGPATVRAAGSGTMPERLYVGEHAASSAAAGRLTSGWSSGRCGISSEVSGVESRMPTDQDAEPKLGAEASF